MNVLPDRCSERPVRSRGGCEVVQNGSSCSGPDRHRDGLVYVSDRHVGFTVPIAERLTSDGSLGAAISTTSSMVTDTRGSLPRRRMDSWRDRLPIRPGEEGEKYALVLSKVESAWTSSPAHSSTVSRKRLPVLR